MQRLVFVFCVLFASVAAQASQLVPAPKGNQVGTLSPEECERLVRRSLFNMSFSPNDPTMAKFVATCVAGRGYYTRNYFNCVFASKYSDALECDYVARGIDRSKTNPELAARKIGDDGEFHSSVPAMTAIVYKGRDPHITVPQSTHDKYLSQRDNILKSLGESTPLDGHLPFRSSNSRIVNEGLTYWLVREDFRDLQLVKILRDDPNGSDWVTCARFGSSEKLLISNGYCAALIAKYLHVKLSE